ncbi:hypothetical protein NKR19_g1765 [Coniochaeta hoffmannii]|uniref:Uncharacterized protein n=1 Tax=Coniochaeta hoffmannii TaxID=91930 RepID=A0AA38SJU5_9PEZI|nr:hypothetical protein NKR19_g1765 [Coniochaeta hoffmannii]
MRAAGPSENHDPAPKLAWGKPPGLPPGHHSTIVPVPITPWWSSLPPVSRSLYQKATADNDDLTPVERLYLLSRLDLPGKALAHPDSLTEEERDFLLGRPPPRTLVRNIRRLFPSVPSAQPEPVDEKDSHGGGEQRSSDGQTRKCQLLSTVAEVVDAFGGSNRLDTLSYEALEYVALGWRTMYQDLAPAPWEDWDLKTDDAGAAAAAALLSGMRPGEAAFEDAAREAWLRPENMEKVGAVGEPEPEDEEENLLSVVEKAEQHAADAGRLREELCVEVARRLGELSEEDRTVLEELQERMVVEVKRDAEEDARRDVVEAEERKRKEEEEAEEKRRKRARRKRTCKAVGEGDEDDSDEGDYALGTLLFD